MGHLLVTTFAGRDEASRLRQTLRELGGDGRLSLDDAAVIRKDADGTLAVDNELDRASMT